MENFEGQREETKLVTCVILKRQKEAIKKLIKDGIIDEFNMSLFLRTKLDDYLKEKMESKR